LGAARQPGAEPRPGKTGGSPTHMATVCQRAFRRHLDHRSSDRDPASEQTKMLCAVSVSTRVRLARRDDNALNSAHPKRGGSWQANPDRVPSRLALAWYHDAAIYSWQRLTVRRFHLVTPEKDHVACLDRRPQSRESTGEIHASREGIARIQGHGGWRETPHGRVGCGQTSVGGI
jgi:hypothetical protein